MGLLNTCSKRIEDVRKQSSMPTFRVLETSWSRPTKYGFKNDLWTYSIRPQNVLQTIWILHVDISIPAEVVFKTSLSSSISRHRSTIPNDIYFFQFTWYSIGINDVSISIRCYTYYCIEIYHERDILTQKKRHIHDKISDWNSIAFHTFQYGAQKK